MNVKLRMLSDRQKTVIETIRMRLTEKQSLEYLKEMGFDISPKTYYNDKRKVESLKLKRLYHIAQIGFQDQHLETIDQYEMGFKMMWKNVLRETSPYRQNIMIRDILMLKPYLSAYYEATKFIVEKNTSDYQIIIDDNKEKENESKQDSNSLPTTKRSPEESTGSTDSTDNINRKF